MGSIMGHTGSVVPALTRPGGTLAIQEPDATPWACHPPQPAWERLKAAILAAFCQGGGDFNAGRRTFGMLRAAVLALHDAHPDIRLPVQFATSLVAVSSMGGSYPSANCTTGPPPVRRRRPTRQRGCSPLSSRRSGAASPPKPAAGGLSVGYSRGQDWAGNTMRPLGEIGGAPI